MPHCLREHGRKARGWPKCCYRSHRHCTDVIISAPSATSRAKLRSCLLQFHLNIVQVAIKRFHRLGSRTFLCCKPSHSWGMRWHGTEYAGLLVRSNGPTMNGHQKKLMESNDDCSVRKVPMADWPRELCLQGS